MSKHTVAELLSAVRQFGDLTDQWHRDPPERVESTGGTVVTPRHLHAINFALWHLEDAARAPGVDDRELARLKRGIDDLNARRNVCIEALDAVILRRLGPFDGRAVVLHTETPGTIVDRLSVLALRVVHARDARRPEAHLVILGEQYRDLSEGLDRYLARLCTGEAGFKLYRQFKSDGQRDRCATFAVVGSGVSANIC